MGSFSSEEFRRDTNYEFTHTGRSQQKSRAFDLNKSAANFGSCPAPMSEAVLTRTGERIPCSHVLVCAHPRKKFASDAFSRAPHSPCKGKSARGYFGAAGKSRIPAARPTSQWGAVENQNQAPYPTSHFDHCLRHNVPVGTRRMRQLGNREQEVPLSRIQFRYALVLLPICSEPASSRRLARRRLLFFFQGARFHRWPCSA